MANAVVEVLKKLIEIISSNRFNNSHVIKDNIIWCINVIMELINLPKNAKKLSDNQSIQEFSNIYEIAIYLFSNLDVFITICENFIKFSYIIFSIFRLFRKLLQIISDLNRVKLLNNSIKKNEYELKVF